MSIGERRPLWLSGLIGIVLIAVGLLVNLSGPSTAERLPPGFVTPVIAFEFAGTAGDITAIFGSVESAVGQNLLHKMISSTELDFLFLFLYGAFLLSLAITAYHRTGQRRYRVATVLAFLAPLFDILENLQMLAIMDQIAGGEIHFEIILLRLFTWLKWASLALNFLLLGPFFGHLGKFGRFVSLFAMLPAALGILAFFLPGLINELFALATVMMFALMIACALIYTAPQLPSGTLPAQPEI